MLSHPADAVVVLGRGIANDGTLPSDPQARVRKAAQLYQDGAAPRLIMSGRYTFLQSIASPRTEAAAMKEYAVTLGVPAENIICEEESVDTIGNAYFTKVRLLKPRNWHKLIVVVSPDHLQRSRLIFDTILGSAYDINYATSENVLSPQEFAESTERERKTGIVIGRLLYHCPPGDEASVWAMLQDLHPGYSSHPHYSIDDLKRMVAEA